MGREHERLPVRSHRDSLRIEDAPQTPCERCRTLLQTDLDVLLSDPRYKARIENPFGQPSAPIELKDASRECRWFNAAIQTDHIWRAKRKGWDQVRLSDVADPEQIGGYVLSTEGYITRGERGHEILMSMPKVVRAAVQAAKTDANRRHMGNPNAMKKEVVEAAGRAIGSEAADYLNRHIGPVGGVNDTMERVERLVESE
jgi:hypothetical protein